MRTAAAVAASVGTMVAGTSPNVLVFAAADTGRLNRDFDLVTADGKVYRYEPTTLSGHVFVQLVSTTQLKIEVSTAVATCGDSTTWSFSGSAATFAR